MKNLLLCLLAVLMTGWVRAQERVVYTVNDAWRFCKGSIFDAQLPVCDDASWEIVNIPHTWNDKDCADDEPGFYRGPAWYRKSIFVDKSYEGERAILYFEGANQETQVYVNGHFAGSHIGGYTRFCFDITPYLHFGEDNLLAVCVNNAYNPDIPPLSADFTFFGGIYRDVYLQFVDPIHLAVNDYASTGVYIRTPQVSAEKASVEITSLVSNDTDEKTWVIVENTVIDGTGKALHTISSHLEVKPGTTVKSVSPLISIPSPHLWDIDDPYLYRVCTRIYHKADHTLLDEVQNPLGLRWFEFDADKGFFLNGKHHKLVGTARHQDYLNKGNALPDELHIQDVILLKQMGGNFLRVSHYPQDPAVMEMCDKLGIVTSVEIPVINAVTQNEAFLNNSIEMAREMVRQDFNRPSVLIWGYMNEILLRCPYTEGLQLKNYYQFIERVARALEKTIRHEDPSRYTMMAYHNNPKVYEEARLTDIPMIQGWNLYQGWYEPDINEFGRLLDRAHRVYKGKALIVTEYGPGVDVRLHSYHPERFDFSQEYGLVYHQHYLKEMGKRSFIAGSSLWNLNDFYSEPRMDTNPHINNKGILGLDREKKDLYLFYQASLLSTPFLQIGNREWKARGGRADRDNASVCTQQVPVFSNAEKVELTVNGRSLGAKECAEGTAFFEVPFTDGENVIEAVASVRDQEVRDLYRVNFTLASSQPTSSFTSLNVMMGSPRYFDDREAGLAWIPEQAYQPGSWGYVGGEVYRRKTDFGSMLGTDADILGTDQDPLFQTQREGLTAFKADVPDGVYSVSLYFAELNGDKKKEALAYNLGADAEQKTLGVRIFDIAINGQKVTGGLNIARECGINRALIKKYIVNVQGGKGLTIDFLKKQGETILNAIRICKNY